jgi:hypothetical protein
MQFDLVPAYAATEVAEGVCLLTGSLLLLVREPIST